MLGNLEGCKCDMLLSSFGHCENVWVHLVGKVVGQVCVQCVLIPHLCIFKICIHVFVCVCVFKRPAM